MERGLYNMTKNMRLRIKEDVGFEVYHPETNFEQVLDGTGKKLSEVLIDASTTAKGLVQLSNNTNSTSVILAATAASVKAAYDLANGKASTAVATSSVDGLMAKTDKSKLDGVATGANNYVHPANHPASIITQDASNRFVSDTEKATWNAKASTSVATASVDGLMAKTDKSKLDGIATGANNYTHPANHPASMITGLSTVATSGSFNDLANKPTIGTAASLNTGKANGNVPVIGSDGKLDPSIMPAIAITDTFVTINQTEMLALDVQVGDVCVRTDLSKTFILRAEPATVLANWQDLLSPTSEVTSVAGKTGAVTLTKADVGLTNVANESRATILASAALTGTPTAPTASAATNTTQVATTAFVKTDTAAILASAKAYTDTEVANKVDKVTGKQLSTEDFTSAEKTKLTGIATGANNYVHPANHPASIITQDASNRFVTDAEKATWNAKASTALATASIDGLMPKADKSKLDGIATGANNYTHPTGAGNNHIPTGGSTGQYLKYSASGTAAWATLESSASGSAITDTGDYFISGNVEGALQEIGQAMSGVRSSMIADMNALLGG